MKLSTKVFEKTESDGLNDEVLQRTVSIAGQAPPLSDIHVGSDPPKLIRR